LLATAYDMRRFGFYRVGNFEVFSKIEAIELSERLNQPVHWNFNDKIFGQSDWSKEPESSLSDLYIARARQIRDQYDHVVLLYSSGADSHNMLESFLHAGVCIDEIASFHVYSADHDRSSVFNNEIFNSAIPHVQYLQSQGRLTDATKFRLIDMSEMIDEFAKTINWLDYPYLVNSVVSINNVARSNLRKYVLDWANLINQGKKLALVWAHDKPRIMHDQGGFFLNFMDIYDNCVSTNIQQKNPAGWFDEMFYSSPDMPEVVIKQAHVIKKFLKHCPVTHPCLTKEVTGLGHVIKTDPDGSQQAYWLLQNAQDQLIYPWFNSNLYIGEKPKDTLFSLRDTWFWKDPILSHNYTGMVNSLLQKFGSKWINVGTTTRSTKNYRSQKYYIG
jgi:hypothetical protein